MTFFVWLEDGVTEVPEHELDLLGAAARGKLEDVDAALGGVLDTHSLRRRLVKTLGLKLTLADLDATASKSVTVRLEVADLVVTAGVCSAGLEAERGWVCGKLKARFFFFAVSEFRSAGAERD